ncbi:MAG: Lon protease mitochondrial, partial [Marteilia pararefringens]
MPYNFIYTINDPHLIDLIRYRVMTNQNFVSIFLRRFDLSDSSEISNIEDLMPYGTFGEIKELKNNENSVSILVQGHAKIKLKSFINQSITDHINDFELSNLQQTAENSMAKKSSTKPSKKQQFQQLKANKRQLDQLKKAIIQREATKVANTDISSSDDAADQSAISTEKPRPTTLPLLVDTEYLEDQFESFSTQTQTPRIKALTAELVKSLSEIYFYNPLILEYIHLIYPQHQEMFESPSAICYFVAFQFNTVTPEEAYKVFACENLDDKLQFALDLAKKELEMRKIGQQINKEVEDKIKKHHRKFLLQEQLKEIKKQLGVVKDDKEAIEEKIRKKVQDFGNNIPPNISTKTQEALDADHYGMEDLKRRIIEFVAISKLNRNSNGKILCFYGPPGVGKTSIGKSIASALNRKYFRFSVGGMGDVAEIKGHRRTYVGSMPGKIVQCLKKVQTMNPLVVIDEIDKIGRSSSHDGDCSSALLELLDPEQNSSFLDHYIDSSIDLSKILFICTANSLQTIPGPLKDRMELIEVNGYTPVEKEKIAT